MSEGESGHFELSDEDALIIEAFLRYYEQRGGYPSLTEVGLALDPQRTRQAVSLRYKKMEALGVLCLRPPGRRYWFRMTDRGKETYQRWAKARAETGISRGDADS